MPIEIDNYSQVSLEIIEQRLSEVANQPEKYVREIIRKSLLEHSPFYSIDYHIEKWTGLLSKMRASAVDTSRCGITAEILIFQNMFGHKHVKSIHSQEEFFNELKSKEPGVFRLDSSSRYLDHVFILIKMVGVNGIPSYKVVQSFNKVYTLKQFLQNHGNHYVYKNFQDLECRFLEPLIRLLSTKGVFTIAELQLFSELTCVDLNVLKEMPLYRDKLNRPIPSPGLGISITRTSNVPNSLT